MSFKLEGEETAVESCRRMLQERWTCTIVDVDKTHNKYRLEFEDPVNLTRLQLILDCDVVDEEFERVG